MAHTSIEMMLAVCMGARAASSDAAAANWAGDGIGLSSCTCACCFVVRSGVQSKTGVGRIVRRGGLFGLRFVGDVGGLQGSCGCCCDGCGCSVC